MKALNLKQLFFFAALAAVGAARAQPSPCWDFERDQGVPRLGECPQVIHYGPAQDEYAYTTRIEGDDHDGGGSGEPGVDAQLEQDPPESYQP